MLFNYFCLGILLMGLTLTFYAFIYVHDIPHRIAKKRHHPQEEAIHVACWLSLFTLHALWPLVFMWAVYKPGKTGGSTDGEDASKVAQLERRIAQLESALGKAAESGRA